MRISTRTLGWYHIFGAVAGALMSIYGTLRGAALVGGSLLIATGPFVASAWVGYALLKSHPSARRLAMLVQLLQVPIVILPAVTWKFVAGIIASITLTAQGLGLNLGVEATWFLGRGDLGNLRATLGLNIAPLIVIALLVRAPTPVQATTPGSTTASRPAA